MLQGLVLERLPNNLFTVTRAQVCRGLVIDRCIH
jgi:hypothetical protein